MLTKCRFFAESKPTAGDLFAQAPKPVSTSSGDPTPTAAAATASVAATATNNNGSSFKDNGFSSSFTAGSQQLFRWPFTSCIVSDHLNISASFEQMKRRLGKFVVLRRFTKIFLADFDTNFGSSVPAEAAAAAAAAVPAPAPQPSAAAPNFDAFFSDMASAAASNPWPAGSPAASAALTTTNSKNPFL